ncbi:MAG: amidophosphoribosyltransferase [Gammaproteobacteria bacterium]|nr:amidophosphoribosyltransferase [Gammaproteobacteria bacterium]
MCGIVGLVSKQNVSAELYDALTLLQHRGQDAAGMATCEERQLHLQKGKGLVRDVVHAPDILRLRGCYGLGHVRYPTAGTDSAAEAQPLYVNSPYGLCLVHNGNLTNAASLQKELWQKGFRHLNTRSDSEVLLNVFAEELQRAAVGELTSEKLFHAVGQLHLRCKGAYAVIVLIAGYGLLAFRDPYGIRPLSLGVRKNEDATSDYLFASETVALHSLGFQLLDDVAPGEAVFISTDGQLQRQQCAHKTQLSPCLFEFVYLSRPDSIMSKILVYKVRLKLGEYLAEKLVRLWPNHDIDVIMPVPETSRTAAYAMSLRLGLKYREGLVKNNYIGRTFIMPGQAIRRKSVQRKLNAIDLEFQGKNVLLVDDSIVRGTTSREIIELARAAGAKKVYFASAAPEVISPNVYGIDMPRTADLIAHNRSVEEIRVLLNADGLIFQDLKDLIAAAREGNPAITQFEDSVFSGNYITGDINAEYLEALAQARACSH